MTDATEGAYSPSRCPHTLPPMADMTTITSLSTATPTRGRTAWQRNGLLLALVAALALIGAACGGSDDSSGDGTTSTEAAAESSTTASTTTTTAPLTFEQASEAYEGCLGENGSSREAIPAGQSLDDLAETDASPEALLESGIDEAFLTAHKACWPAFRAAMDAGATPPMAETTTTTVDPVKAAQMAQAVQCLKDRGWDFLEPGVETGALTMAARQAGFNWDDPGFLRDQMQCQQLAGMMG